jgi:hypothetical protein
MPPGGMPPGGMGMGGMPPGGMGMGGMLFFLSLLHVVFTFLNRNATRRYGYGRNAPRRNGHGRYATRRRGWYESFHFPHFCTLCLLLFLPERNIYLLSTIVSVFQAPKTFQVRKNFFAYGGEMDILALFVFLFYFFLFFCFLFF